MGKGSTKKSETHSARQRAMNCLRPVAPVVLFTYNRIDHTMQTIHALSENLLAPYTDLIVYSDGPRKDSDTKKIQDVRTFLKEINGFKSVRIIEQERNRGLARSIISGISATFKSYDRVIVMEDDIVTSPLFLSFMNDALNLYEDEKKAWHISGWNYPIDTDNLPCAFFWRVMNCWGWATWANRWCHFRKEPARLVRQWNKRRIKRFNLDGVHDFWSQVVSNFHGRMDTWAVFWYATIFENQGLCLNPTKSYVRNIGLDGTGIHCKRCSPLEKQSLNMKPCKDFPVRIEEDCNAVERIKRYHERLKRPLYSRIKNKIMELFSPKPAVR